MVLSAIRGAVGFLTRLPVGRSERAWVALGDAPTAMVPVAYLVGGLVGLPVALGALAQQPASTTAIAYLAGVFLVTGVAHADGLADVGDALVVHGPPDRRRAVMADTQLGVGGTVALGIDMLGLALAAVALASIPLRVAIGVVVAAEVGAKLAMVALAVGGTPAHSGMGAELTGAGSGHLLASTLLAAPASLTTWPASAGLAALVSALVTVPVVLVWADRRVGGLTGDVFGACNEVARLTALHAGVIAWTLS